MQLIQKLKQKARKLKAEAQVLIIAFRDSRIPVLARILIGITVGYLLSPIDLIPDFIPVLGLIDDLIIVPLLIAASIKLIPNAVLNDAREQLKSNPRLYKKNNWIFAIFIIFIWIAILYTLFKQIRSSGYDNSRQ